MVNELFDAVIGLRAIPDWHRRFLQEGGGICVSDRGAPFAHRLASALFSCRSFFSRYYSTPLSSAANMLLLLEITIEWRHRGIAEAMLSARGVCGVAFSAAKAKLLHQRLPVHRSRLCCSLSKCELSGAPFRFVASVNNGKRA
jgi:hypothetical protein